MEKIPKADSLVSVLLHRGQYSSALTRKFLLISQVGYGNTAGTKKRGWKTTIGFPSPASYDVH